MISSRKRITRLLVAAPAAVTLIASSFVSAPALAIDEPMDCPTALPTADAVIDLPGTGWTVEKGMSADSFSALVLGRITDGIAPGVDMIMAEVDSPALQRAHGVWAGMSGSPVYTDDGQLIGAVAYTLVGSSMVAGITPAEAMMPLLTDNNPTEPPALPDIVKIGKSAAARLQAAGDATAAQTRSGFRKLTLPVGVSGAASKSAAPLLARLEKRLDGTQVFAGGSAAKGVKGAASAMNAGGNFAAAMSYGDITMAGVGTTTFVCDGVAVAFGHPFNYDGETSMTAHDADALFVQSDPGSDYGPFKVANVGGIVGVVTRDRLTGISAELNAPAPPTTAITSSLTVSGGSSNGKTYTGSSTVVYPVVTPDVAAFHTLYNVERALGSQGRGSANITIAVTIKRASGSSVIVTRSDKYASRDGSLSFAVADAVYSLVSTLTQQTMEKVWVNSVVVSGMVSPKVTGYTASGLRIQQGTTWVKPGQIPLRAKAGGTVAARLTLTPYSGAAPRDVVLSVPVPMSKASANSGLLWISAGTDPYSWDFSDVETFTGLILSIRQLPTAASVTGSLAVEGFLPTKVTRELTAPVEPYEAIAGLIILK